MDRHGEKGLESVVFPWPLRPTSTTFSRRLTMALKPEPIASFATPEHSSATRPDGRSIANLM
jgi:hypothetical protein